MLPARFPNLLANGSSGIAVGMATSIPPHNAAELCDAALHLIENPERHDRTSWSNACQGPDFPTGGIIVETARAIAEAYETGRGGVPRARALGRRRTRAAAPGSIVVTEIPYQVQKSRLIEKIAELLIEQEAAAARRRARRDAPRTSASCWSRRAARSIPAC